MSSLFVCANGPSIMDIEYKMLDIDIKVFRMNNFFFEKSYYAGKK